ncbi:YjiH family protein [Photobacterium sp. DNB23_23_1]|uniref:YjiH family protein n=1 Tax=Photobacterium pectinilyticum TaxID=2906793 RepID=A0ABT1MVX4_9GAMM|nr:YjiH family protein [Photobacterium sp. ZSDE20]MCQ1056647.1 YjiH family protein [Photobacterium sp. ZSDE20]MDD1820966.1 YjiH family protein [Photobacterium sp. ZSDE20]
MQDQVISQSGKKNPWLMFALPSLLGVFLFMAPVSYQDSLTIPIAILAKSVQAVFGDMLPAMVTFVIALTAVASIATKLLKPKAVLESSFLSGLLNPSLPWFVVQQLGAIFVVMTYFGIGPEMIHHGDTGGLVLNDLLPVLFSVFLFAGLLLPLLLNFGLLEFVGALFTRVMRPLFNLPGRSAVNCIASWLGDGSVGVLMTSKQYESKIYTEREAAVIGTTFTAVSITFSLVVIAQVNLEHMFAPFYMTVCLAGLAAAVIVPRLPPLSWKKDRYIDGEPVKGDIEALPEGKTVVGFGLEQALEKASQVKSLRSMVVEGVKNAIDMIFGVLPVVMAIGTIALVIAENTPVFSLLGQPFIPFLELLRIPEAAAASETIVVGFADMFLPSILASGIESDLTRFVIAAMSVTQLIYMSEIGALLIGSKIPVKPWELFMIFILRTLVTLPVIAMMAHIFF